MAPKVLAGPSVVDGEIARLIEADDGSTHVETWQEGHWYHGGVPIAVVLNAPLASYETLRQHGIQNESTEEEPSRSADPNSGGQDGPTLLEQAILKGVAYAELDRRIKLDAQKRQLSSWAYDPEKAVDEAILKRIRNKRTRGSQSDKTAGSAGAGGLDDATVEHTRDQLLQYPGINESNVDMLVESYEDRCRAKDELRRRGFGNAMAEAHLDRQGYPRPPGWHGVFFYPDSYRPRNPVLLFFIVGFIGIWLFLITP